MTKTAKGHWRQRLITWLSLRWNIGPPTDEERSAARSRAHERYLRGLRRRRVLRRRTHSIDAQKWPLPLLRWLAVFGLALAWWAEGARTGPPHSWVPFAVIAGALILPDIAGFAVGGFRLDLKQAQEEISRLRTDVYTQATARANSTAIGIALLPSREAKEGLETLKEIVIAGQEPQETYVPGHLDSGNTSEVS